MNHAWTGGQYSVFRVLLAAYLFQHFLLLIPWGAELFSNAGVLADSSISPLIRLFPNFLGLWDAPWLVSATLVLATFLCVLLAIGWRDRVSALLLWYIWACLFGRNPLIANPGLPYVGWLLLAHAIIPSAPYGSWSARGRADPRGNWRLPEPIFGTAWLLMALGYSYSGYTKLISPSWLDGTALVRVLNNPLARPGLIRDLFLSLPEWCLEIATWGALAFELLFAPLALFGRLRPWLWLAMLMMHLTLMMLIDFADLSAGMVVLHMFTFDPAWVRRRGSATAMLFYDGNCGLCHRAVRFLLAEDRTGTAFRFAPLESAALRARLDKRFREDLPDSIVILETDGSVLSRSQAVIRLMERLGGMWRILAIPLRATPRVFRDRAYDLLASARHRLWRRPVEVCPVPLGDLRDRFDL